MRAEKKFLILLAAVMLLACASLARAWETEGALPATELAFSGLEVSREGVAVRLTNTSHRAVKISSRITFYDERGNTVGYALFGLREIPAGSYVNISGNHLTGNWRHCRDAHRMVWEPLTYELVY